jgi:hypothetical protein
VDGLGHAADVWGSKCHEFLLSAATVMILPMTDDLGNQMLERRFGAFIIAGAVGAFLPIVALRSSAAPTARSPKCKVLIFKENGTSLDILGHAVDVWGSKAPRLLVLARCNRDDLAHH